MTDTTRENQCPLLEFDPSTAAMIEPSGSVRFADAPEHCVVCFPHEVVAEMAARPESRVITHLKSEMGPQAVYETAWNGRRIAFLQPGLGAPLVVGSLEEVIALGCRKFITCGYAGALADSLDTGHVVIPVAAVRDEGTSFHYMPPGREIGPTPRALAAIEAELGQSGFPYVSGKTWTTDAFYRETPDRVRRRRAEGCITVEMEASAMFALAHFRGVELATILYAGDDLSGELWDARSGHRTTGIRQRLFDLAAEACLRIG